MAIKNAGSRGNNGRPLGGYYKYQRNQDWPATGTTPPEQAPGTGAASQREQAQGRCAEFARLRGTGKSVRSAGRAVGVSLSTARRYERRRKAGEAS